MRLSRLAFFDGSEIGAVEAAQNGEGRQKTALPESALLLKFGANSYTKGGERGRFEFSESDADNVMADFATRGRDLVIDYEHQTLSGAKAPAAGWISSLEKSAEGLVARVRYWTDEARSLLSNGEYRYLSPVLHFSRSGRSVSAIHSVALTNHPALHEAPALVADDAAEAGSHEGLADCIATAKNSKGVLMDELLKTLGLLALADASEQEKADAVSEEIGKLQKLKSELGGFLELHDCPSLDEMTRRIGEMVPASEKLELEMALRRRDAGNAVAKAFSDGKLAEKSRGWAESFAERDLDAFNDWAAAAPRIVPDNNVDAASRKPLQSVDEAEMKILRALGIPEDRIAEVLKAQQPAI